MKKLLIAFLIVLSFSIFTANAEYKSDSTQPAAKFTDINDLAGKKVGVITGTRMPEIVKEFIPEAKLEYVDTPADNLIALRTGKIDAFCTNLPMAKLITRQNNDIAFCGKPLTTVDAAPIFAKTETGRKLCEEFSEFIKAQWDNGTIQELDLIWFGNDESKKTVKDYSGFPAPNGTLKMAVDLSLVPFAYVKDNKIVGYDVDAAVRFCEAYGYGIEIIPMSLGAVIPALQSGKCDFAACSIAYTEERAQKVFFSYPSLKSGSVILVKKSDTKLDAAPIFAKTEAGEKLCAEFSEFIKAQWDNGTIDALDSLWFGNDESKKTVKDYANLPAPNGTLKMATDPSVMPFAFVKDGRIVGYDVDMAVRFCEAKGYGLEVFPMNFAAMIPAVQSGKCDFAACTIAITPERAEQVIFAYPNTKTGNVLVVSNPDSQPEAITQDVYTPSFMDDLKASFERTFIREERWRLFIDGINNTMIITVMSIIFGTILGFVVYLSCRGGNFIANFITRFFVWLIQGMPMVVLLMILYYIIFGKVDIAGIWVAVIAFSMTFGAGVYGMLSSGVNAIDSGQTEAAYALGFTDRQSFFTIILPQAALHFMPAYKAEVVALIKATAIVGYIAVQDLTKMGDIVRSRTYEAFFPLIAVAAIYFILAGVLNIIIGAVNHCLNPREKKRENILKGIRTHD